MNGHENEPVTRREFDEAWRGFRREHQREREDAEAKVVLAKNAVDKELRHLNELRDQYTEMLMRLPSKSELESVSNRISLIERWQANLTGRLWAMGVGAVVVGTIIGYLVTIMSSHWNPAAKGG